MTPSSQPAGPITVTIPGASDSSGRNGLALVGFLLSLAPLVELLLLILIVNVVSNYVNDSVAEANVDTVIVLVWYGGSLITSSGAIVTAALALGRTERYPPQQAKRGLAIAGLVIGIICTTLFTCGGLGVLALGQMCSPGC